MSGIHFLTSIKHDTRNRNMNTIKKSTLLIVCVLLLAPFTHSASKVKNLEKVVFKIGRSIDRNEIHYILKVNQKGELNQEEPLEIVWMNNEDAGQKERINWIKKKFGYGLIYQYIKPNEAHFNFVSYDKRSFTLKKNKLGEYKVFTSSNGKTVEVQRIFINIEGGSFWIPNITFVELSALEPQTNAVLHEIIKP